MKRIYLMLALCLFPLKALAEGAAPEFDCTPICGNPTCCIAQSQAIPVCSVSGQSPIARLQRLAAQNKSKEIADICLGDTKTTGVNPIVPRTLGDRIRRITCNWGCCDRRQTVASLERSPALAEKMFAGTTLASVGREISQKGTVSPQARSKIGQGMDGGVLCIFCCHF